MANLTFQPGCMPTAHAAVNTDLRDGYLSSFQLHFLPVTLIALLHPVESMPL
jgi:hypothetical protein